MAYVRNIFPSREELIACTKRIVDPAPFEILARGVAYAQWQEQQKVEFDGVDGYTVAEVFKDTSGFYALGLESDAHGPALVIRGTDGFVDLYENTDRRGVGYGQFEANRQDVYGWLSELGEVGKRADIVGHSLGGALAQWIAADFTDGVGKIDELVTFNSPGISNTYASHFEPDNATAVTHYVVNGDLVTMAGEAFVAGQVQMASFSDLNLLNKHLLPLLVPSVLNPSTGKRRFQPSDLSWQSFGSVADLNESSFSYKDEDYNRWLVGMQVGLRSLDLLYPGVFDSLVPVPAILKHRGTTEAARRAIGEGMRRMIPQAFIEAKDLFEWTAGTAGRFVLTLKEPAHDLYEATRITVQEDFNLVVRPSSIVIC